MTTIEIAKRILNKDSNTVEKSEGDLDLKDFVDDTELRKLCWAVVEAEEIIPSCKEYLSAERIGLWVDCEAWLDKHAGEKS